MAYNPNNSNGQKTSANSAPVVIASDQSAVPISAASLPLPSTAATSTKQSDGSQKTQVVDGAGNVIGATSNALDVNIKSGNPTSITANAGTNLNTSSLALETGGNLASVKTNTDNLALSQASTTSGQKGNLVFGAATTASPSYTTTNSYPLSLTTAGGLRSDLSTVAGTTIDTNSGNKSGGTPRVVLATDQPALTNAIPVSGLTAADSPIASAPVTTGGRVMTTALPTAMSAAGDVVNGMYDEFGRQIVVPNTHRKLVGSQTTSISNTTETTIITAGAAGVFNDLIALIISNTSTTALRADIKDATAGSTIFSYYIPAGDTRGISLATPWPQTTAASNWTASLSTTPSAAVYFSATYAKNK